MRRVLVLSIVLVSALTVAADDFEKVLLTVAPSVVNCGYDSHYDTRLVVFNSRDREVRGLPAQTGAVIEGADTMVPLPSFIYLRKEDANALSMSLLVESSDRKHPEARSFNELPVVREREFTAGKIQIPGVRMDEGFRKTLRIYGLDGHTATPVRVRVYSLAASKLLFEHDYSLMPAGPMFNAEGQQAAPAFNMECDLSNYWLETDGTPVRVEVEPLFPATKIWAFVSVTNNTTQHFYNVLPQR
ncbi:MAG: hypothetical protein QOH21_3802 [Acidobacteriota bacterium]|jgi:hypothetical protein|nr:hypothetical protein [Acidobacteriota bacterium]